MDNQIKAVIFDLGNVVINFDHSIAARRISCFTDKNPQEIYNLFFNSPVTQAFEEGKIAPLDFFLAVKEMLALEISYEAFLPIWNEIFFLTEENRVVYRLAKSLNHNYKLAVLSNVNILHMDFVRKNFPVFDAFHYVFTSYELGCIKPNPLIYKKVLELLSVSPSETFYTDDRAELIEKAAELGIRAFVYKSPEQLKEDLSKCGIKIDNQ